MAIVDVVTPFVLILIFLSISLVADAVTEADALLKLKSSFGNAGALRSWHQGTKACDKNKRWEGAICSRGTIYGLRLEEMNLSGTIDVDALVQIPGIRSISFMSNSFSGPIPEFNRLGALRALFLSSNQFSGEIQSNYFTSMQSLKKVWLSENEFSGKIPSSLAKLQNLMELHLENNHFSGEIPEFQQSSLLSLDLANNNLTGEIPSALAKFNASSFKGNVGLCGENRGKPYQEPEGNKNDSPKYENPEGDNDDKQKSSAVWALIPCAVIVLLLMAGILFLRRRQKSFDVLEEESLAEVKVSGSSKNNTVLGRNSESSGCRGGSKKRSAAGDLAIVNDKMGKFGFSDLMKAAAEVLGNGVLGSSYKAMMSNGLTVMVKRVKEMNKLEKYDFDIKIRRLARLKHKNVLAPVAYSFTKDEKLLVSEYMPKGSLLHLLHGDGGLYHAEIKWPVRLKIIHGIAQGLGYIHTELAHLVLPHGNLKSCNVLLSHDYEPMLADYGFYSLISTNQAEPALFAYKSPEAARPKQVSPKCDVYCLGVIILELLTRKLPSFGSNDIAQWVRSAIADGRENELFDPEIVSSGYSLSEMVELLHIGVACIEPNLEQRLNIGEVISRIEDIRIEEGDQAVQ